MSIKPSQVYSAEIEIAKAPAADWNVEGPEIPEGCVVRIETLYAIDLTTASKKIRLGYKRGGTSYWLKREDVADTVYGLHLDRPIILVEGEKPIARIESASADDNCIFVARGIYL